MEYAGVTRVTRQGQITLPSRLRRHLQLKRGDTLEVYYADATVVIRKKRVPVEIFEELAERARRHFKESGITRRDVEEAISSYRRERREG